MKRVFPVALVLALMVFGMAALADKAEKTPAPAATPTAATPAEAPAATPTAATPAEAPAATPAKPAAAAHDAHVMKLSELTWKQMDGYPAGVMKAEVCAEGGVGSVYAKFPAGIKVGAHTHPAAHWGTVVSGTSTLGFGTDPTKGGTELGSGGYFHVPAKAPHWLNVKNETIVFVVAHGPDGIDYLNPADDPRKGQAKGEEQPK